MRTVFLVIALLLAVVVIGAWVFTGADMGWSKTEVAVMKVDPVTEIEFPDWEKRLVLGVDFLVLGLIVSVVLALAAFILPNFFRTKAAAIQSNTKSTTPTNEP